MNFSDIKTVTIRLPKPPVSPSPGGAIGQLCCCRLLDQPPGHYALIRIVSEGSDGLEWVPVATSPTFDGILAACSLLGAP